MKSPFHLSIAAVLGAALVAFPGLAPGAPVPDSTLSPNHRYGVTVPDFDDGKPDSGQKNKLVEVKTGRVLAVIDAFTGSKHMNNGEVLPSRWSSDSSLLLWEVDGKWTRDAVVLLQIVKGEAKMQVNVLKVAQQAILNETRKAAPKKYAAAKVANAGNGSAYPEGFTVEVEAKDPVSLPLRVHVVLTSDPKTDSPALASHLEGVVDEQGQFKVTDFHLGVVHTSKF